MRTINPKIFDFFKELNRNNNRDWFEANKATFKRLEAEVKVFASEMQQALNESDVIDKTKVFRIYRDVRFSKDKTPYKTHFGVTFHREKPRLRGGYYIHLKPRESFIATGFWDPHKDDLYRIRKEIESDASEYYDILKDTHFRKQWGALEGDSVKTAPKGFSKEHPDIELIRKKQHIFTHKFTDAEVLKPSFFKNVLTAFLAIRPYFDYMSHVLTTDLNGVSVLD